MQTLENQGPEMLTAAPYPIAVCANVLGVGQVVLVHLGGIGFGDIL